MISVVVPVYNAGSYLASMVSSLKEQDFQDWELILVDDGSTDSSPAICDSFAKEGVATVIHQSNAGANLARKAGVEAAAGEWISFIDSDDRLPINALSRLAAACSDDCDIVVGHYLDVEPRGLIKISEYRRHVLCNDGVFPVAPWAHLYRKSLFGKDSFSLTDQRCFGEDHIMNVRLAFATSRDVVFVGGPVYIYNQDNQGSLSRSFANSLDQQELMHLNLVNAVPESFREEYRDALAASALQLLEFWLHKHPGDRSYEGRDVMNMLPDRLPSWIQKILDSHNSYLVNRWIYWFSKRR